MLSLSQVLFHPGLSITDDSVTTEEIIETYGSALDGGRIRYRVPPVRASLAEKLLYMTLVEDQSSVDEKTVSVIISATILIQFLHVPSPRLGWRTLRLLLCLTAICDIKIDINIIIIITIIGTIIIIVIVFPKHRYRGKNLGQTTVCGLGTPV